MNRFLLLALTAGLSSPLQAEPIPKISDFDASISYPYRLEFSCPMEYVTSRNSDGMRERKKISIYENCWVDFHKEHMEIMGKQKIQKKDIVKYWFQRESFVGLRFHFHFVYRNNDGRLLEFIPYRKAHWNTAEDPKHVKYKNNQGQEEKFKIGIYQEANNFINKWMAQ